MAGRSKFYPSKHLLLDGCCRWDACGEAKVQSRKLLACPTQRGTLMPKYANYTHLHHKIAPILAIWPVTGRGGDDAAHMCRKLEEASHEGCRTKKLKRFGRPSEQLIVALLQNCLLQKTRTNIGPDIWKLPLLQIRTVRNIQRHVGDLGVLQLHFWERTREERMHGRPLLNH
eukprot:TRINITY_DN1756_c0_g4_i1.p1 TRINITY_DN1756_c0_g4~~TRINITY_DN1756_c0_g4_i1.p1  ORF type:complete len:172 (-),score=18.33 TRINITY_DN1756_c0_g4_i1:1-516(-)